MKKLLLTLGSATAVVAPIASVIACGSDENKTDVDVIATYDATSKVLSIVGLDHPPLNMDGTEAEITEEMNAQIAYTEGIVSFLRNDKYKDAVSIVFSGKYYGKAILGAEGIALMSLVSPDGNTTPFTNLGEVLAYAWQSETIDGITISADANAGNEIFSAMGDVPAGNEDASPVEAAIGAITGVTSTLTANEAALLGDKTSAEAITAFELVGITAEDIEDALKAGGAAAGDWVISNVSGFDADTGNLDITFNHKDESGVSHTAYLSVVFATE